MSRALSQRFSSITLRKIDRATIFHFIALAIIMSVAVGIRIWRVNEIGYNTDEAVYAGQAAAISQDPTLKEIFPVFRAHPLLFQFMLAVLYSFGITDLIGRLLAVAIGTATVYVVYRLGDLLYDKNVGLLAALILALMPYHVIVSRQVLLDGPLVFCSTLPLYLLARFASTAHPRWLHAVGVGMGLTFLAKETGIILLGSVYAFLALSSEIRIRIRDLVISLILMLVMIAPFPVSLWLAGSSTTGQQYLIWQFFRRPNHTWDFYLSMVPNSIGIPVIIAALLGFLLFRHQNSWRERLLLWWIFVPVIFFQIWPTKGFQYLLPIAPPIAVLASRTLIHWRSVQDIVIRDWKIGASWFKNAMVGIVVFSLMISTWQVIQPDISGIFLAGTGGVPGGREAGMWVKRNVPEGATLMTIGPSMANILQFYGNRKALGLSVSPNPLHRNPSYEPIHNPDFQIRTNEIQYLVWDSYSAGRSNFFSEKILELAKRYHGQVVHTESVSVTSEDGSKTTQAVIVIYKVHP
jgi:hypothetical protein